jgi:FtsZ-binding cell division protein ZapB
MGMTIDDIIQGLNETIIICNSVYDFDHNKYIDEAKDKIYKYQRLQADYEQRLNADLMAILTEIQLEVEELKKEPSHCHHYERGIRYSSEIIQQKINDLKAESEDKK